ncbi:hypothetical protein Agabi119p4_210 [Agaricus bisporus var. burnettii]|uniref:Phosphatidylinositol-specific phospholipase C X domain-containing protein n=1 Tax=Agaricus bisporus var. burnettii TaxID=192524 RepID=A0A8H7KKL9_AGABI|nr:hypothetical protein Agabi119p4_210 [Agaricus bisporus var. burnettii]
MRLIVATRLLTQLSFVLFPSVLSVLGAPNSGVGRRATVCNGHAELCDKSYGSVVSVGSHDSYAIAAGSSNVAANQDQNITTQLDDGIRMLQMQAHNENGVIKLCHTACVIFDGGTLQDYLTEVKSWLDANPNEVLSLLIVNSDSVPVSTYDEVFKSVGLDTMGFIPPSLPLPALSWPTLGSMIDSGKRLVTFMDHEADGSVPYIIDEFTNIWETAFNVVDPTFDCNVNRTNTQVETASQMYLINHFLDKIILGNPAPDIEKLNVTNAATGPGSLGAQVETCVAQNSKPPNFLLVDFYEFGQGSVFQVAADLNGVQYTPTKPIATPVQGGASTSSSAQTSSRPLDNGDNPVLNFSWESILSLMSVVTAVLAGPQFLL